MNKVFPYFNCEEFKHSKVRFFLGDVRDKDRLKRAFNDIDIVVHAAALKQVPTAEYNPTEFINTNVIGAQNIIEAAIDLKVKQVIALSTDKAVAPINLYGATKLCSDKLFIAANDYAGFGNRRFSIVRYGNVISSRGSVIPKFKSINEKNISLKFPVTDIGMTRFLISLRKGVETVIFALNNQVGGEIFVPKMQSCRVIDICSAINKKRKIKYVGIRPGEKLHEEIKFDMPEPRTLIGAWKEMIETWRVQKLDLNYQFDTPVPDSRIKDKRVNADPLASSIGDLAPNF